ncbi:MAG: DUF1186 domain-containing protein [Hyphomicrobiaceae bacterium]|nr:DUF1186 domain-containing protein [Hyphomicrobiaceae bacterium]
MSRAEEGRQKLLELLGESAHMPADEIIRRMTYIEVGRKPTLALALALARAEEVRDRLLDELSLTPDEVAERLNAAPDERHAYFLHVLAVYLLGLWEDVRAYRPLVAYLAANSEAAHAQLEETVTEDLHTLLGRVYDGSDLAPLKAIIEDGTADPYVRDACLRSLHVMARLGKIPRDDVITYYQEYLEAHRNRDWARDADFHLVTIAEMREPALRPAIQKWFAEGLVDTKLLPRRDIRDTYEETAEQIDEDLLQVDRLNGLLDYICDWAWFNVDDPAELANPWDEVDPEAEILGNPDGVTDWEAGRPLVREGRKIGRNEPCPCGSGKKYKRCCLDREQA